MATDNTSDISENDIIVAFELKNNSNPLAIYLEYQSKLDQIDRPYHTDRVSLVSKQVSSNRVVVRLIGSPIRGIDA